MQTATDPPPPPYYKLYNDYEQETSSPPEPSSPIQGLMMYSQAWKCKVFVNCTLKVQILITYREMALYGAISN
ncbi:hypothetical protein R6Q59_027788 [Mikania micrantha]